MRRGMSLIEVLIAAAVLSTVLLGLAMFQVSTARVGQTERDRTFATQKAVQMMEEILASQVTTGTSTDAGIDTLDDGANFSYLLTIDPKVSNPSAAISGNISQSGRYRYVRHVSVARMPNDPRGRRVTVALYMSTQATAALPADANRPLATVTNIVKSDPRKSQPGQVYDIYVVKIENLASWWGDSNVLEDSVKNTIQALQTNNPGLQFRTHWIRHLAYGRDPFYAPFVNQATTLAAAPMNWAYLYPGTKDSTTNIMEPAVLQGQMLLDGTKTTAPYAFADQFNHAMRYPDEVAKQAAVGGEPTLRLLLDDLCAGNLKNAIIINLHTENLPIPPLQNYADAAKVPQHHDTTYVKSTFGINASNNGEIDDGARCRLVTHPRRLGVGTQSSSNYDPNDTVDLRVYPYLGANWETEPTQGDYRSGSLVLRGVANDLWQFNGGQPDDNVEIDVLQRVGSSSEYFDAADYNSNNQNDHKINSSGENGYYWVRVWPLDKKKCIDDNLWWSTDLKSAYNIKVNKIGSNQPSKDLYQNDVQITWDNLPFTHKLTSRGGQDFGLRPGTTLHGFNYFPDPLCRTMDDDLPAAGTIPRNTARMRVLFKLDNARTVEAVTTMGGDPNLAKHQFPNRSSTYCWVGKPVPFSEQYQFTGDPRHNPYDEVRANKRYNRCFADLTAQAYNTTWADTWNTFAETSNGWSGKNVDVDIPRMHEYWRQALFKSNAEFVNPGGWSFYYYSVGGEFADNGNSVSLSNKPYTGGGGTGTYDEMGYGGRAYLVANPTGAWYCKPWLGELYPEAEWDNWRQYGNLPSATYRRKLHDTLSAWPGFPAGTNYQRKKALNEQGAVSFFNGGAASGSWFTHYNANGRQGLVTSQGNGMSAAYNLSITDAFDASRPFVINDTNAANKPTDWSLGDVTSWRNTLEWGLNPTPYAYYAQDNNASYQDAAPILMRRGSDAAYVVMLGTDKATDQSAADAQSRVALMSAMESFFDDAKATYTVAPTARGDEAVKLLPRINITAPLDDAVIAGTEPITWAVNWQRWNTQPYSSQVTSYNTNGYRPVMAYNLKYSNNGGASWYFCNGNNPAKLGVYDPAKELTGTTYNWNTPGLPAGDYQVRLEAFRKQTTSNANGYDTAHYAYHQLLVSK